jgi:hypothetical protein
MSNFNMIPIGKRVGRRITVFCNHSSINGRKGCNAHEEYSPYELTIYENCISIRQGGDNSMGANITWYPFSDIIRIVEYQAEGYPPIELKFPQSDGLGNVLQQ